MFGCFSVTLCNPLRGLKNRRAISSLSVLLAVVLIFSACNGASDSKDGGGRGTYDVRVSFDGERLVGSSEYTLCEKDCKAKEQTFAFYPAVLAEKAAVTGVYLNGEKLESKIERSGKKDEFVKVVRGGGRNFSAGDKIKFDFEMTLKKCGGRLGITDKVANFAAFYPMKCPVRGGECLKRPYAEFGDPFSFDFADYDVTLSVPSDFSVACGMTALECDPSGSETTYVYGGKNLLRFAFSASEFFNVVAKKSGNRSINYYYYLDETPEKTLSEVVNALDHFSRFLGDYAYRSLSFAQSPYDTGGMEYPGFFVLGENKDEKKYLLAAIHETAHQWFPIAVCSDEYDRACFDEGLAEFLTLDYVRYIDSAYADKLVADARGSYEGYKKSCLLVGKKPSEKFNMPLDEYASAYEYVACAYSASMLAFDSASSEIGRKAFFSALSAFYKKYKFKNADSSDFFSCFSVFKRERVKKILEKYV